MQSCSSNWIRQAIIVSKLSNIPRLMLTRTVRLAGKCMEMNEWTGDNVCEHLHEIYLVWKYKAESQIYSYNSYKTKMRLYL